MKIHPITSNQKTLERARLSGGTSHSDVYDAVVKNLTLRCIGAGTLIDVGCGCGNFWKSARKLFAKYLGIDVIRYSGFPPDGEFVISDLEEYSMSVPDEKADAVIALETIEHLDNPRAFVRELVRLVKPGGWLIVTTPNQLSVLSKMTLVVRNEFNAFQAASYPAHRTALLEIDLVRMAADSGLCEIAIKYTDRGRIPFTSKHWPPWCKGRLFSDNVLLIARKPSVQPYVSEYSDRSTSQNHTSVTTAPWPRT